MNRCHREEAMPLAAGAGGVVDAYAQARKALCERSPFESPEETARLPSLPVRLSAFLSRFAGEDNRRKHRRSHHKAEAGLGSLGSDWSRKSIWKRTEDYFRPVTLGDMETLSLLSRIDLSHGDDFFDPCLLNPSYHIGGNEPEFSPAGGTNDCVHEEKPVLAADFSGVGVSVDGDADEKLKRLILDSNVQSSCKEENDHHPMEIDTLIPATVLENGNIDALCGSESVDNLTLTSEVKEAPSPKKGRGGRISKRKFKGDQASVLHRQRVQTRSMAPQMNSFASAFPGNSGVSGLSSVSGGRVRMLQSNDIPLLVSSRAKVIPPKRSTKKRGLSETDPQVEKLIVSNPAVGEGSTSTYCHVCGNSGGEENNRVLSCATCHLLVHQKCYGVKEFPAGRWLCSWCSYIACLHGNYRTKTNKNSVEDGADSLKKPCVLCPNSGGALKPIAGAGQERENRGVRFSHLFCCLWIPEVHSEDAQTLEPIVNIEKLKENYKKLPCALCKVKHGACILCSNASCRTSFHPLCAREAKQGLEIRRKVGSGDAELLAFCSRHSPVHNFKAPQPESSPHLTDEDPSVANLFSNLLTTNGLCKRKSEAKIKKAKVQCAPVDNVINDSSQIMAKDLILDGSTELMATQPTPNCIAPSKNIATETSGSVEKDGPADVARLHSSACTLSKEAADSDDTDGLPIGSLRPKRRNKSGKLFAKDSKSGGTPLEVEVQKLNSGLLGDAKAEGSKVSITLDGGLDISSCVNPESSNTMEAELAKEIDRAASLSGNPGSVPLSSEGSIRDEGGNSLLAEAQEGRGLSTVEAMSCTGCGNPYSLHDFNTKSSRVHPFIHIKLMQMQRALLSRQESCHLQCNGQNEVTMTDTKISPPESFSTEQQHGQAAYGAICYSSDLTKCKLLNMVGILGLSPADEVEGEILFFQNKLLESAIANKHRCEHLVSKVVRNLSEELENFRRQRWDALTVNQFLYEVREAKKQGRKEKRYKEAQAVLAAATAASSRVSSLRKDIHDEVNAENTHHEGPLKVTFTSGRIGSYSQLVPRAKETVSRLGVAKISSDKHSEFRKEHHLFCSICRKRDRASNRVSVCVSCKVSVHMDCYRILKNYVAPWYCEPCEEIYRQYKGSMHVNMRERLDVQCALCGRHGGAFRKSTDAVWVHVVCAEWLLESVYVRGQPNPVEVMESLSAERDLYFCCFCCSKQGICIKCNSDECDSSFHPSCAREANLYMSVKVADGKVKHKAYCRAHGPDQMEKVHVKPHGPEELSIVKRIRVDFEQLRILCERIIKREKLKRDLLLCSHDILASKRDCVAFSVLYNSSFVPPDVSSCSVTTSLRGCTDDNKSWSEVMQKSDEITVDSSLSGVRGGSHPAQLDMEIKSSDRSKSEKAYVRKKADETAGKHLPEQSISAGFRGMVDEKARKLKCRKHTETLQKEVVMTPIEASMQNQRLPKGFAYVPVDRLAKEQVASHDAEVHDSHS